MADIGDIRLTADDGSPMRTSSIIVIHANDEDDGRQTTAVIHPIQYADRIGWRAKLIVADGASEQDFDTMAEAVAASHIACLTALQHRSLWTTLWTSEVGHA